MRRSVSRTPIGSPVAGSRPAGTQAEGNPIKFAGTTGRIISIVAATFSSDAASNPSSNGNCVHVGERISP
jgi:hypothetical protein